MKFIGITILFIVVSSFQTFACRFTVREIGFSILSQDIYTLAVLDENADAGAEFWKSFHKKNRNCNLRLEILNPNLDMEHPIILNAKKQGLTFPTIVLVAPDGRLFEFEENDLEIVYDQVLESVASVTLRSVFSDVFAVVLWIEASDDEKNNRAKIKIQKECDAIENIMPGMPKIVEKGPMNIRISKDNFQNEKLLLWSLGIDEIPKEPLAFVLYGRGRIIGEVLDYKQILNGGLYKYMSMIGADCECGLDKKWMLGSQVPLLWDKNTKQYLVELLGFDVDNPMILAEMSRILAKETLSDATGSIAFAPESIDLDEVFEKSAEIKNIDLITEPENKTNRTLFYTLALLLVVVLVGASLIYFKK